MILTTKLKAAPSEHIRNRVSKMRAELAQVIQDFENIVDVRVEPDEEGKAVRIVRFIHESPKVKIICFEEINLANCKANRHSVPCSHIYAAVDKLIEIHNETKESQ